MVRLAFAELRELTEVDSPPRSFFAGFRRDQKTISR